ncbi:MAG TPA: glycosyltransferase family 1 protein [Gemmatimonadaceae bacterium]|nr:glycosyltransferase family 1 protein [Gemmatimonadaceae bacterium]
MLTIGLDAAHMRQAAAGIARYADGLARALRERGDTAVIELGGGPLVARDSLRRKFLSLKQDLVWYPLAALRRARQEGAQVYHSPLLRGPLSPGAIPVVLTVHDMVPSRWPQTMPRWHRLYTSVLMRRILATADRVITPSQDTAKDVVEFGGVKAEKLRVVPNGIDAMFFDDHPAVAGLGTPYVLFVGTPEPRKNLPRLVEAMSFVRSRDASYRLVIAGGGGWGLRLALPDFIDVRGRVHDEELRSLYAGAACLALPSLHEGFGLPALEAMACGTPVVASDRGALPEITGGAAVLVDALDPRSIANGIERAIDERGALVSAGKAHAQSYTWERTAALTREVYRELV